MRNWELSEVFRYADDATISSLQIDHLESKLFGNFVAPGNEILSWVLTSSTITFSCLKWILSKISFLNEKLVELLTKCATHVGPFVQISRRVKFCGQWNKIYCYATVTVVTRRPENFLQKVRMKMKQTDKEGQSSASFSSSSTKIL